MRDCCADSREPTLVLEVVNFFFWKPHIRLHPPPCSPTPGFVYTEPPWGGLSGCALLSCLPPYLRSSGAVVSGRAWYLWGLRFSPWSVKTLGKKLFQPQCDSSADCMIEQLILVLRLLFSTRSVQSSRFCLMDVPSRAAWLHWIIQLSYDALRPCHSGPRRTCWLSSLSGLLVLWSMVDNLPLWPSLRQGSNLGHTCSIKTIQGNMFICFRFRACICENMGAHP